MGIMMVLHLVKGPVEEELELNDDADECLPGCKINATFTLHMVQYQVANRLH
jgi:hypothetical protein